MTRSLSFVHSRLRVSDLLEQHFDTAFAAPDGIARLRELILTLAMQGKLVEQDPNDPPASELLKEIEKEKASHEGTKTRRKEKLLPVKPEEVPYELPKGWEWVRLGEIGQTQTGTTPKNGDNSSYGTDIPFIKPADITANSVDYCNEGLSISGVEKYGRLAPAGSSLMVCIGTIGKTNIINLDCSFNQQINAVTPYNPLFPFYIQQFMRSSFFQAECWKQSNSTTIAILNKGKWESIPVALPPLPEQHRIVARIDQLMARCDALEKLRKERAEKRLAVHAAAIKQLLDPSLCAFAPSREENSSTLRAFVPSCEPFAFLDQHFGELYTVKENVAELRKAILQLAVMGRLVEQDPNEPPASELLKEIEKERASHEGTKTRRKEKLPPVKPEEVPYELPQGWEWVRLGDLTTEIATGPFGSMIHKSDYVSDGIPLINPSHMIDGKIVHDLSVSVSQRMAKKLSSYRLFENDIVMARRGEMGRCAIVTAESDGFLCGTGSFVLRFIDNIDRQYILNLFKTEYAKEYLGGNSVGTTMTNLNHGILNNMPVLLPPLPEQHRIVARIDQLMALCDTLDQQIDAATGKQIELLNAVMAAV
ncbi:restriction endonuclease subunit S [Nitrosomonas nitrosa]|uniref:restriction endonuclease subunit S n=1 Tax=Nitrosomonas nitrosa TaxID=52442 RepID=UPI0023F8D901|nr:restriction endonuclease subunit S [Nitrosomonas nitrosa]MCO6435260.1 restriction endonuclease subunit S [Nitrosomonas nitrosa]